MIREKIFTYGEHQHGIGVLSEPADPSSSPIIVLLNAGLSHRAEPYRLNVLLSRKLASLGYISLRVDLSGKGDSPARPNLVNRESVDLDWLFIKSSLEKLYGSKPLLIFGLCSGADNGIKICAKDDAVKGLVLLDPVSRRDPGFSKRDFVRKATNANKWIRIHKIIARRLRPDRKHEESVANSPLNLRDQPTDEDTEQCFAKLMQRDGRVLAVFTSQALSHYNKRGQFASALNIEGMETIIDEEFWPNAKHIFPVERHRARLIETVAFWAETHLDHFRRDIEQ